LISNIKLLARDVSRQSSGWAQSMQNTDIKGPKHLTDSSREQYQQKKAEAFMQKLKQEHEERIKEIVARRAAANQQE